MILPKLVFFFCMKYHYCIPMSWTPSTCSIVVCTTCWQLSISCIFLQTNLQKLQTQLSHYKEETVLLQSEVRKLEASCANCKDCMNKDLALRVSKVSHLSSYPWMLLLYSNFLSMDRCAVMAQGHIVMARVKPFLWQ